MLVLRSGVFLCLLPLSAIAAEPAHSVPDLSGIWAREFIGFEPPASGHGPIANLARIPTGQGNVSVPVGDYHDPILKPEAAEILKRRGEISLSGRDFPLPSNQCGPQPMPYVLWQQEIELLQERKQVVILYLLDHQVRHVRLNARHPARVTPSWSGDSVGRYDGDTLLIDTVGVKAGPQSVADQLGTPQSEAVHVVERYRLVDHDVVTRAAAAAGKEHIRIPSDTAIGDGVAIDPDYKGKGLQLQFTVDDPKVLNAPWSAGSTYQRAAGEWVEIICAENTHEYYANIDTQIPRADKPDF